jgi:RimJ/RimL family protein N-acetyltransferase
VALKGPSSTRTLMTLQLPIQTDRLIVRRLKPSDLERFSAYRADPVLAQYQGWAPMSNDEAREFIASMLTQPMLEPENWVQLAIANGADDELLGDIGLCLHENGDAELGFTLRQEAQGNGFAIEALRGLARELLRLAEVARIVGVTDEHNEASIRVLERLGMTLASRYETTYKQEPCVELRYELTCDSCGCG